MKEVVQGKGAQGRRDADEDVSGQTGTNTGVNMRDQIAVGSKDDSGSRGGIGIMGIE